MKIFHKKVLVIILLSCLKEQLIAGWRRTATGSALATGMALSRYSGNGDALPDSLSNQKVNAPVNYQINWSINPVVYPQATDFKNYNAMSDGTYKLPSPQVKNAANTKVIKPYFGTAGLIEANKKSDALLSGRIKVEDIQKATKNLLAQFDAEEKAKSHMQAIQGLTWSQLSSDEEKLAYLKNAFKDVTIPEEDIILPYLVKGLFPEIALENQNQEMVIDGIIAILKYAASWNKNELSYDLYKKIQKMLTFNFIYYIKDLLLDNIETTSKKQRVSNHEMAHALVGAQLVKTTVVVNATNRFRDWSSGHIARMPLFKDKTETDKEIFNALHELQSDAQNLIILFFAGVIGEILFLPSYTAKPTFQEFKAIAEIKGGGTRNRFGSDIYNAYQTAESYIKWQNFTRISQHQEEPIIDEVELEKDMEKFLEESYHKAFDFLIKNKKILDEMSQTLMQKRDMGTTEIYKLAGVPRQKYNFELTLGEKLQKDFYNWVAWTGQRLKFFEDQYPSV